MSAEILLYFLSPFFGVLIAFGLERLWKRYENHIERDKFLQDIKKELESCSGLLTGKGNLCPVSMWKSGISSGIIRLIPIETRYELASIYFSLECHNYEAEKVRDVSILRWAEKGKPQTLVKLKPVLKTSPPVIKTYTEMLHYQLSVRLIDSEKKLRKRIDALLKKQIWN